MKRRSIQKKKADKEPGGSKYALKVKRREKCAVESENQHIPIEKLTQVLTMEQKQLLMTEMKYGLSGKTLREYTESELKYIVGYCLTNALSKNFKFLPSKAARFVVPALGNREQRKVAIEALKAMNYKAARFIVPALGNKEKKEVVIEALKAMDCRVARFVCGALLNPNQKEAAIEALKAMNYKAARFIVPALNNKRQEEVVIEALKAMDYRVARYLAPALKTGENREAAIETLKEIELKHKGRGVGQIIRKYSYLERDTDYLLNNQIYSAIKEIYQMENSPIKRYVDLAMKLVREENKPKFFSGLEKVLTT